MTHLPAPPDPDALDPFFARLSQALCALLLLDYDGTLAPFRLDRTRATPWPGVREALAAIQATGRTRLVLVSGRPVGEVADLLGLDPAPEIWGVHGLERRTPDGRVRREPLPPRAEVGLEQAAAWAASMGLGPRTERKHGALAIHLRGMSDADALRFSRAARAALAPIADRHGLAVLSFVAGVELRVPSARKARAVTTLLSEMPDDTVVACLGDDATDEDAFEALHGRGETFLVRVSPRPSHARWLLPPPEGVLAFLARWAASRPSRKAP
ncbi:MAG: trehalose-phosphatase [Deltaproteobacteria bacterium]|nr:trehalose-phosphatase [Deltaproteobacteria bacterium]